MGCSLFFMHVSKFLMGLLTHKSPVWIVVIGSGMSSHPLDTLESKVL